MWSLGRLLPSVVALSEAPCRSPPAGKGFLFKTLESTFMNLTLDLPTPLPEHKLSVFVNNTLAPVPRSKPAPLRVGM